MKTERTKLSKTVRFKQCNNENSGLIPPKCFIPSKSVNSPINRKPNLKILDWIEKSKNQLTLINERYYIFRSQRLINFQPALTDLSDFNFETDYMVFDTVTSNLYRMPLDSGTIIRENINHQTIFIGKSLLKNIANNENYLPSDLIKNIRFMPQIVLDDKKPQPNVNLAIGFFDTTNLKQLFPEIIENNYVFEYIQANKYKEYFIPQEFMRSCAFACINMFALGKSINKEKLLEQCDIGLSYNQITSHLIKLLPNYKIYHEVMSRVDSLELILSKYGSVIADVDGHIVVIDSIIETKLIVVRDPFHSLACEMDIAFANKINAFWFATPK